MPNKIARPAREWLSDELDTRREQLLRAIDEDPMMLLRMWEWCYGRAPQALDITQVQRARPVAIVLAELGRIIEACGVPPELRRAILERVARELPEAATK